MNPICRTLFGATLLAAAACASGSGGAGGGDVAEGVPRWTGTLSPTTQRSAQLAPRSRIRANGTVELTPAPTGPTRTRVRLTLTAPAQNRALNWAVLPGNCGSPATPVIPIDLFPPLEIGASGRGQLDVVVPMSFMGDGSYHVAVYWGSGDDIADILTCANLRRS